MGIYLHRIPTSIFPASDIRRIRIHKARNRKILYKHIPTPFLPAIQYPKGNKA